MEILRIIDKPLTDASYVQVDFAGIGPTDPLFFHQRLVPAVAVLSGMVGRPLVPADINVLVNSSGIGYIQEKSPAEKNAKVEYVSGSNYDAVVREQFSYLLEHHGENVHRNCKDCVRMAEVKKLLLLSTLD